MSCSEVPRPCSSTIAPAGSPSGARSSCTRSSTSATRADAIASGAVDQPLLVLLLPRPLERFDLEQPVRTLLRADGVVAVDPPRFPLARMPANIAAGLAVGQARRMRLPGTPAAVAILHPAQLFLAGALLARHPDAVLWYGRPEDDPGDVELDEAARTRAAITMPAAELLATASARMAELGLSAPPSGPAA